MTACRDHKLVADIALFADRDVLFVRYKDVGKYDGQRGWFLPDDLLGRLEHPAEGARRIAREQAGVEVPDPILSHMESFEGGDGSWHLIFHYAARLTARPDILPSANVAAAEWFPLEGLPSATEVAHHGWALEVVAEVAQRLRLGEPASTA